MGIREAILSCMLLCCSTLEAQVASPQALDSVKKVAFKSKPDTASIVAFTEIQRHFFNSGQYDSALYYSNLSRTLANKINAKRQQGRIFYNAGLIYTNLTRYDSAIFYLNEAEKMAL
ncbi:MAG: hypothetical protein EOO13_04295, partial [Chitinophagaceae bacterium]